MYNCSTFIGNPILFPLLFLIHRSHVDLYLAMVNPENIVFSDSKYFERLK